MRPAWRLDILLAVVIAGILMLVTAGFAISGLIALLVLLAAGISLLVEWRTGRRPQPPARGRTAERRPPSGPLDWSEHDRRR